MKRESLRHFSKKHFLTSLFILAIMAIPFFLFLELEQDQKITQEKLIIWNNDLTSALLSKNWILVKKIVSTVYTDQIKWIAIADREQNIFSYPSEDISSSCLLLMKHPIDRYKVNIANMNICYDLTNYLKYSIIKNPFVYCLLIIFLVIAVITYFSFQKYKRQLLFFIKELESDLLQNRWKNLKFDDSLLSKLYNLVFYNLKMKLKEQEIKDQTATASKLSKFTNDVFHNLKSPLSILVSNKNILSNQAGSDIFVRAIDDIVNLSNNILSEDRKRLQAQYQIKYENVSQHLLSCVKDKQIEYINCPHFPIQMNITPDTNAVFCKINFPEFKAIISNLINNSVEAFDNNEGQINISTSIEDKFLKISIIDNGPGIPADILSKLLHERYTTKPSGNGIGISHLREQIKLWDGHFEIKSTPGKETEVILFLPVLKNAILIEDKEIIQENWKYHAKKVGINLQVFSSYKEFDSSSTHIDRVIDIFLDLTIPNETSGEDFAEYLFNQKGFKNIWLQTGKHLDEIKKLSFIKGVIVGKIPPWKR